jgi:hypothetical protein
MILFETVFDVQKDFHLMEACWLTHVILTTWEAKIRMILVSGQPVKEFVNK